MKCKVSAIVIGLLYWMIVGQSGENNCIRLFLADGFPIVRLYCGAAADQLTSVIQSAAHQHNLQDERVEVCMQ